ncbi:MAG: hypothetical protein B1H03_02775 [Planctomycetales bacterium 4484_113]|nr:MAG: hypothetical protein B1H03_02775 [Planctomycetales bacterium 4484_113]
MMKRRPDNEQALAESFRAHMEAVRECYLRRDLEGYLAGFADYYRSFQVGADWKEDKAALRRKMEDDFARYDILEMDFSAHSIHIIGDRAYGHLHYQTKLNARGDGRMVVDERENIVVGKLLADGSWLLEAKIVLSVRMEHAPSPEAAPADAVSANPPSKEVDPCRK